MNKKEREIIQTGTLSQNNNYINERYHNDQVVQRKSMQKFNAKTAIAIVEPFPKYVTKKLLKKNIAFDLEPPIYVQQPLTTKAGTNVMNSTSY